MKLKTKQLILSLIEDDLLHHKLVDGLSSLHINADAYLLNLSDTIIKLMGFNGQRNEQVFEHYLQQLKRAGHIDLSQNNKEIKKLAAQIYEELLGR